MANKTWEKQDYDCLDAEENKLFDTLEQLKSSKSGSYQKVIQAQTDLNDLMAEHRGIKGKKFNTTEFAEYLTKRLRAMEYNGIIHLYNRSLGIYEAVSENTLKRFMKQILDEYSKDKWSVSSEANYYTAFCRSITDLKAVKEIPELLVLNNGVLNTSKLELYPHTPNLVRFTSLPYNYDKDKQAPKFIDTINDIFNGHQPTIDNMQELFGYLLYYGKNYPLQKLFIFYGEGRNGKGVISQCINMMLGADNCSAIFAVELQDRFGRQNLVDKMVNISPEKSDMRPMDTAYIKSLTGGDTIEIEQKYKQSFSTKVYTKFIICTNEVPRVYDTSNGFLSRLVVFNFENTYVEDYDSETMPKYYKPMNKNLINELAGEKQGILNWALAGLKRLRENNWNMTSNPEMSSLTTKLFRGSSPVYTFVTECVKADTSGKIKTSTMFKRYKEWAVHSGLTTMDYDNNKKFRDLFLKYCKQQKIPVSIVKNNVEYYRGVNLTREFITSFGEENYNDPM